MKSDNIFSAEMFVALFASFTVSSSNYASFKVDGSMSCPDAVTNTVTDVNEELKNTNQAKIDVYVGKDDVFINEASLGAKEINFIACSASNSITINFDDSAKAKKLSFSKLTVTAAGSNELAALNLASLSLQNSQLKKGVQFKWNSDVWASDMLSGNSDAVSSASVKNLTINGENILTDITVKSNVFTLTGTKDFTYNVEVSESAYFDYFTTDQFTLNVQQLTVPVTIKPLVNGTHMKIEYDDTISMVTIDNTNVNMKISTSDKDNLKINYRDATNIPAIEEVTPISTKLNAGQIIGIVIAVILIIGCILACVFISRCEAKEQAEDEAALKADAQVAENDQEEPPQENEENKSSESK